MAKFKNAKIDREGKLIRVDVDVDIYVPITGPSAGRVEWNGVLNPPNNIGLVLGELYRLDVPGYVPTEIEITSEANPVDASVTFKGVGELTRKESIPHVPAAT